MSLVGDKSKAAKERAINAWTSRSPSCLSHHQDDDCPIAMHWLVAMDRSLGGSIGSSVGPVWLRELFDWGPSHWPLFWCDIPSARALDCGALAAISVAMFRARALTCASVQMVQIFAEHDADHWRRKWSKRNVDTDWMRGPLVYHEGCAVVSAHGEMRLWDPTDAVWIEPDQIEGYAATVAVRVHGTPGLDQSTLQWGTRLLRIGAGEKL